MRDFFGTTGQDGVDVGTEDGALVLKTGGVERARIGSTGLTSGAFKPLGWVNVKDYGAMLDGVTDDTTAIQNAINDTPTGGTLYIPAGSPVITNLTRTSRIKIIGEGPEKTTVFAKSGTTGTVLDLSMGSSTAGCALEGVGFDLSAAGTANALRVHNWSYDGLIHNTKFRKGNYGLDIGNCDGFTVNRLSGLNMTGAAIHIGDAGLPNVVLSKVFVTLSQAVTMQAGILIDSFLSGLSMEDIWIIPPLGTGAIQAGIQVGTSTVPSGVGGHFIQGVNVNTDAISGPGLKLLNVRGVQMVNSFLSSAFQNDYSGVEIDGGLDMQFSNNWISGQGVEFKSTNAIPNRLVFTGNEFPQTQVTPVGAFKMTGNAPTNLKVDRSNIFFSKITDNNSKFYGALEDPTTFGINPTKPTAAIFETVERERVNTTNLAIVSGQMFMQAIYLPKGFTVNNITAFSGATALAGGSNQWFALYDKNLNLLGVTSDDTTNAWGGTVTKTLNLATPFTTTYAGLHYIGITVVATTMPTLSGFAGTSGVAGQSPKTSGNSTSGLTTPATAPATAAALAQSGSQPYIWVA